MRSNAMLCFGAAAAFGMLIVSPVSGALKSNNRTKLHHSYHTRAHDAGYRSHRAMQSGALPYAPEYGFLPSVPSNAIRMPDYTFVPGVGILGASCDLPSSACSNQYRDVQ